MLFIHRLRESRPKTASKSQLLYNSRTNQNTIKQGFNLSDYAHTPMVNYPMSRIELHTIDEYFPTHRFFYTELSESPNVQSYAHLYPSGVSPYYSQGLICIDPFCACHSSPLGTVHPREDLIPTDAVFQDISFSKMGRNAKQQVYSGHSGMNAIDSGINKTRVAQGRSKDRKNTAYGQKCTGCYFCNQVEGTLENLKESKFGREKKGTGPTKKKGRGFFYKLKNAFRKFSKLD